MINKASPPSPSIGIVIADFYQDITANLLKGVKHGLQQPPTFISYVPGAFELPFGAKKMYMTNKPNAIICLGAVIKGETDHYEVVCQQTASGILSVSLELMVPIMCGVLMTKNKTLALARAEIDFNNPNNKNKGYDMAISALRTCSYSFIKPK